MNSIDSVIEYLKSIQDNLIGIMVPAVLTAIVSVITLVVNSILQYKIYDRQYKSKQYEIMRQHYPSLKSQLIDIQRCFENIECNQLYPPTFQITKYIGYDWEAYRQNITVEEIQFVDDFEENIKSAIKVLANLNLFFNDNNLPTSSKKVQYAINDFQIFCSFFDPQKKAIHTQPKTNFTKKQIEKWLFPKRCG